MKKDLYHGKRKDNGEWIFGYLVEHNGGYYIYYETADEMCQTGNWLWSKEVIRETVGQSIGLDDKINKAIFEGDIVHAVHKSGYTGIPDKDFGIGVVKYNGTYYGGAAYQIDIIGEPGCRVFSASLQVEVIGNVHDNPELLKRSDYE